MNPYVTGQTIQMLREKRRMTQKQLADLLYISDKTVSKWETGKGLPDIMLLEPLAKALHVSVPELFSGTEIVNQNRTGNMLKTRFYVCPVCGNVISAAGEGAFHCCGILLPPLEPEEPDTAHDIIVTPMDGEYYVRMAHPMTKRHFISFFAAVTAERVTLVKLYKNLYIHILSYHLDYFGHQAVTSGRDVADFILCHRTVDCQCNHIGDYA